MLVTPSRTENLPVPLEMIPIPSSTPVAGREPCLNSLWDDDGGSPCCLLICLVKWNEVLFDIFVPRQIMGHILGLHLNFQPIVDTQPAQFDWQHIVPPKIRIINSHLCIIQYHSKYYGTFGPPDKNTSNQFLCIVQKPSPDGNLWQCSLVGPVMLNHGNIQQMAKTRQYNTST